MIFPDDLTDEEIATSMTNALKNQLNVHEGISKKIISYS